MRTVYLAGPIKGRKYSDAVYWRNIAETRLSLRGIESLSPMRYKEELSFIIGELPDSDEHRPLTSSKGITARDRFDVMRCDAVLMNLIGVDVVSIGSMIEIGWADILRKPIFTVMTVENVHWHSMVRECSSFVVPTLDQAIELISQVLKP